MIGIGWIFISPLNINTVKFGVHADGSRLTEPIFHFFCFWFLFSNNNNPIMQHNYGRLLLTFLRILKGCFK